MNARALAVFVIRRLVILAATLVVLSFLVFSLLYLAPGSVIDVLLGTNPRTPEMVAALRAEYHLDEPFLAQYWLWAKGALRFDFGDSILTTMPVTEEIGARLPTSLALGLYAYVLTTALGVGFGIVAALRRRTAVDRSIVGAAIVALSTPAFVGGVFLIYVFAIVVEVFPVAGAGDGGFLDALWHLTLPAVALALVGTAYILRHTRAALIGTIDQDYVTFARARGLSWFRVLVVYVLRNSLVPVVTMSAVILTFVITGAVLVEQTFSIPGIGQLLVQSATSKDLPMIQGVTMVIAVVIMLASLIADLTLMLVDPRIRLSGQR
jgi:peptide/nickel transport system permease protein